MKKVIKYPITPETAVQNKEPDTFVVEASLHNANGDTVFCVTAKQGQQTSYAVPLNVISNMQENVLYDPDIEVILPLATHSSDNIYIPDNTEPLAITDFSGYAFADSLRFEAPTSMLTDERQDILLLQDILENPSSLPFVVFSSSESTVSAEQNNVPVDDIMSFGHDFSYTNVAHNYYTATDEDESITILTLQSFLGST